MKDYIKGLVLAYFHLISFFLFSQITFYNFIFKN